MAQPGARQVYDAAALLITDAGTIRGDPRGLGPFQGVELVRDRGNREPATAEAAKACYRACEAGLLVFCVGMASNVLEIPPPPVIGEAEVDEGVAILERALAHVVAGRVGDGPVARFAGW